VHTVRIGMTPERRHSLGADLLSSSLESLASI
jgi:hypothetical protein